jgi:hypothetical protein
MNPGSIKKPIKILIGCFKGPLTDLIAELIKEASKNRFVPKIGIYFYGEELGEIAEKSEIDIFILVLNNIRFFPVLPVRERLQNSLDLINQIKSKYEKPVIVLSGPLDDYSSLVTKAKLAADFFFLLPFKAADFLETIEKCFGMLSGFDKLHRGGKSMSGVMEKDEAHKMIDRLPANATWDDLMSEIYVREAIERGMADSKEGRTKDVKEVRAKYGLPE